MRSLLALALLALIAAGAWLLIAEPATRAAPETENRTPEQEDTAYAPFDGESSAPRESAENRRADLAEQETSAAMEEGALALLVLEVHDATSRVAIRSFVLEARPLDPEHGARFLEWVARLAEDQPELVGTVRSHGDPARAWANLRSDASGRVRLLLPPDLRLAFRDLVADDTRYELLDAPAPVSPALEPAQQSTMVLLAERTLPLAFHGQVLASSVGNAPVVGARVHAPSDAVTPRRSETDSLGRFRLEWQPESREYVVLEADGYGPAYLSLERGHETPAQAAVVRLPRAATLSGVVRDGAGPVPGAEVELRARTHELLAEFHFVGGTPDDHVWTATTDASGRYRFVDLAPGAELRVALRHHDGRTEEPPETLRLDAGEEREHDFLLGGQGVIRGLVLDQFRQPVAGVGVVALSPSTQQFGREPPFYLQSGAEAAQAASDSGADGRFVLEGLSPGTWIVGVPAATPGRTPLEVSAIGILVELPRGVPEVVVELEVHRGLFLAGRVARPDGTGASAFVIAWSHDAAGSLTTNSAEDGSFRVGPLLPGEYGLRAMALGEGGSTSREIRVPAGSEGLVLELLEGADLVVEVVGEPAARGARLSVQVSSRSEMLSTATGGALGERTHFGELAPGLYDVAAWGSGWFGVSRAVELRAGEEPVVEVTLAPAGELLVRAPADGPAHNVRLFHQGAALRFLRVEPGQTQRALVPPGTVEVREWSVEEGDGASRTAAVVAGQETELLLDFD